MAVTTMMYLVGSRSHTESDCPIVAGAAERTAQECLGVTVARERGERTVSQCYGM